MHPDMKSKTPTVRQLRERIRVARGEAPADLVLKGGWVVNVFSHRLQRADVAVWNGEIVGLGEYQGLRSVDCRGHYICPGFIDGHFHIESTLLTPARLSPLLLSRGTTTLVSDPHEIANVLGLRGIRFLLQNSRDLPLEIYFMAPSCVPATPLETPGARLPAEKLRSLLDHPRLLGLAEMMNFPGLLQGDPEVLAKVALFHRKIKDGHAPGLSGRDLCAYLSLRLGSDHECTRLEEAREKMALGMQIMIRQGSSAKNLKDLLPLVTPHTSRRFLFVSDDIHLHDLLKNGHLDKVLRLSVAQGFDPISAIEMVTLNPAEYFGLSHLGAVAPGFQADLVVLKSLKTMAVERVYKKGKPVFEQGRYLGPETSPAGTDSLASLRIKGLSPDRFFLPNRSGRARVIRLIPGQILTRCQRLTVRINQGRIAVDSDQDLALLACVERHHRTGNVGLGLVSGFGPLNGALATSVAHDSHNILAVGRDPADLYLAVKALVQTQGGWTAVRGGKVLARLPLPIGGLMSDRPVSEVLKHLQALQAALPEVDCRHPDPFMALSFLALPVIPHLKLTDQGLVDVDHFQFVSLFD